MNQKTRPARYGHDFIVAVRDPTTSRNFSVTMIDDLDKYAAMRRACDQVARVQKLDPCILQVNGCQQIDDEETPVIFRKRPGKQFAGDGVTAVFPCEAFSMRGDTMSCYAHVGQQGECDLGWYQKTVAAKPDEYADLKRELESAPYGYRLKVYSRMQPWMREARRQAVREMKAVQS